MNDEALRSRIGCKLRKLRIENGMSIRQLSELTGVNHSNISAIENGKYNARLDTCEKFEKVFNVKFDLISNENM